MGPKWLGLVVGVLTGFCAWIGYFVCNNLGRSMATPWTTKHKKMVTLATVLAGVAVGSIVGIGQMSQPIRNDTDIVMKILLDTAIGIIIGVIGHFILKNLEESSIAREKELQQQKAEQKHAEFLEQAQSGSWVFPHMEFYALCLKEGIDAPDQSNYTQVKCRKLAEYLLEKHGIPEAFRAPYLARVNEYFDAAKNQILAEKMAVEEHNRTLQRVTPSEEEQRVLDGIAQMRNLSGLEKRRKMLENSILQLDQEIQENLARSRSLNTNTPIPYQKEKDWAVLGGMASAIAGPAVGVVTALNAQADNEKIRQNNAAFAQAATYLNEMKKQSQERLMRERTELEQKQKALKDQLDKLSTKIVFDKPETDQISKHMMLHKQSIKKTDSGVLEVAVSVNVSIPQELLVIEKCVVDGCIHGKIFVDNRFVDDVYFVLPMHGLLVNRKAVTLYTFCTTALPVDAEYKIKIGDRNNLWIMES